MRAELPGDLSIELGEVVEWGCLFIGVKEEEAERVGDFPGVDLVFLFKESEGTSAREAPSILEPEDVGG